MAHLFGSSSTGHSLVLLPGFPKKVTFVRVSKSSESSHWSRNTEAEDVGRDKAISRFCMSVNVLEICQLKPKNVIKKTEKRHCSNISNILAIFARTSCAVILFF